MGMTLDQIRDAYPTVVDAVEWMESALMEDMWDDLRQRGADPDYVLRDAQDGSQKVIDLMTSLGAPPLMLAQGRRILAQMDDPMVMTYIKGKLGAV